MVCATPCEGFMFDRMIDLLRRRPNHFDAAFALSILPESVKIDAIAPFLNFSVREMLHEKRMKQVPINPNILTCTNTGTIPRNVFLLKFLYTFMNNIADNSNPETPDTSPITDVSNICKNLLDIH